MDFSDPWNRFPLKILSLKESVFLKLIKNKHVTDNFIILSTNLENFQSDSMIIQESVRKPLITFYSLLVSEYWKRTATIEIV